MNATSIGMDNGFHRFKKGEYHPRTQEGEFNVSIPEGSATSKIPEIASHKAFTNNFVNAVLCEGSDAYRACDIRHVS